MVYGDEAHDINTVIQKNARRRQKRFKQAQLTDAQWFVECRDLGDAFDRDAGVYFCSYESIEEVDQCAARCGPDNPYDRLMGIYHLAIPIDEQEPGLSQAQWLAHRDQIHTQTDFKQLITRLKTMNTPT